MSNSLSAAQEKFCHCKNYKILYWKFTAAPLNWPTDFLVTRGIDNWVEPIDNMLT